MPSRWNDIPFSPRRLPFFYGWVVLGAATFGILASIPGQTMGVGVFTDYLIEALHLSRTELSNAYFLGTITSSFFLPFAGQFLDRFGARILVVIACLGLGGSLLMLSCSDLVLHALGGGMLSGMLISFVVFLCIRFFGQGCLTMVSRVMVGKWFNHRRGLATAIMGVFMTIGFNSSPQFLDWLVQMNGWRGAALLLAGTIGLGMTLIGVIFFRDNPEDCGLEMDGEMTQEWRAKMAERVPEIHKEFTRGEAVKTLAFWAYSLGPASQGLIITAITFHLTSIGEEVGLDRIGSYEIFFPGIAIFAISSNLVSGWLSDRIRMKWLLCSMMITQAIGTLGFLHFDEPVGRFMIMAGHGISGGMFGILTTASFPRFFGRVHLGAISGFNMSILVMSSAFAPPLFAIAHDVFGSYDQVIQFCALVPLGVFVLALRAQNPQRQYAP